MKRRLIPAIAAGVLLLMGMLLFAGCAGPPAGVNIPLSEAVALSKTGVISDAVLDTNNRVIILTVTLTGGTPPKVVDTAGNTVVLTNGMQLIANAGSLDFASLEALGFKLPPNYSTTAPNNTGTLLLTIISFVLLIAILFMFLRPRGSTSGQAMGIARSRARLFSPNRPSVTFADIAGEEEAKEDLQEVVQALKNRWKFQALGATTPKGVLLVGPPGTGKTLLARAVAGEAGVPFFSVSGSEFVEIFVGVGAARVRDLFEQAKRNAPSIIFVDEIDAVGRLRSGNLPGGHEEREQTLNQILVEMDGFDPNIGVIVLAATNRPDTLDPALLRPGRFDRRVQLGLPDTNGRVAILKIHAKGKQLDPSVDLAVIAKETHGFSGADLANLMNEAAILAVRHSRSTIGMTEIEEAIDRVIAGPERKSLRINPKDKETTAYHEAGHALVAHTLPSVDPVHKISIVARGQMGGYTRLVSEDRYFLTKSQAEATLATLLAGHVSEQLIFSEVSTGPHSDIRQATNLARLMVTDYGMSEKLGVRAFGTDSGQTYIGGITEKDYSEETAKEIDEEISRILESARMVARRVLEEKKDRLRYIAETLLVEETLEGAKLEAAFSTPLPAGRNGKGPSSETTTKAGAGSPA